MYDRKTWIVVIACSLLLALNLYYGQKNAAAARDQAAQEAPAAGPGTPAGGPEEASGELVEQEPELPPVDAKTFTLETGDAIFTLSSLGGGVKTAELVHQKSVVDPERNVTLNAGDSSPVGALADGPDRMETVNYAVAEETRDDGGRLTGVVFLGKHPSGLLVKKSWSLVSPDEDGSPYLLDLQVELQNPQDAQTRQPLENFSLYLGRAQPLQTRELSPSGVLWREDGSFEFIKAVRGGKLDAGLFSRAQVLVQATREEMDYAGVSSQLFATVLRPAETSSGGFWSKAFDVTLREGEKEVAGVRAGYVLPAVSLEPGDAPVTLNYRLFMGPKDNRMLRRMGDGWGDVMNYGWFSIFSRFMNFLLVHVHDIVSKVSDKWSWGLAIIIVTIVVRALMWPLYARSNRTMKRMAKLKPEMDRLKEKYPDDPAKMQQELMGMYRKYGINPVGGCLPMFAQIPVFFGFYRMLQYAVELRGNGFLWVDDLSMPDTVGHVFGLPINILPIVMGISSYAQMHMMPNTSADKTQQTIMRLMPVMFFLFCYNFAAALALYWTTSNLFSIFQTWLTQRMPEPELKERKGGAGKSFMERMAEAAEQQKKMKQARGRVVEGPEDPPKKKRGPRTGG